MSVRCQECGGTMEPRRIEMYGRWGEHGKPVLVVGVPAQVCTSCGARDLDADTAQRVADLWRQAQSGQQQVVQLEVRSFA